MARLADVKSAFVEDDGVVLPDAAPGSMGPPPPKRPKTRPSGAAGSSPGTEGPAGDGEKEWWEVDDGEEEYVPLKKRRDQAVSASAARLGHTLARAPPPGTRPRTSASSRPRRRRHRSCRAPRGSS